MRMRKKKHGAERIAACNEYFIHSPEEITQKPIFLEIGCGKGAFIAETARRNPDVNFIALEKITDVILLAAEKIRTEGLKNVKFMNCDANKLPEIFQKNDVARIYLNFSDPWPKKGYAKRRLTHPMFLTMYRSIMTDDGAIFFKTDNRPLFDFSIEQFQTCGFRLDKLTYDLHASEYNTDNVVTEYEKNFSDKGYPINRVEAYLK